jgi:ribosomal-protein-alanine N-acetyltransferase
MNWRIESTRIVGGDDARATGHLTAREAAPEDLAAILDIEAASHPTPWPPKIFEGELDLDWSHIWVFEQAGDLVAFLVFWVVHDEIHILNIAVAPKARRRGIATTVITDLVGLARENEASFVTLEVRKNNRAAIQLYESLSFVTIGARPGYYADTGEDAMIMSHLLE